MTDVDMTDVDDVMCCKAVECEKAAADLNM
jgi:hypothetical protein